MNIDLIQQAIEFITINGIGYCRIAPAFFLLPFFSSGNVPATVKFPVISLISFIIFPEHRFPLQTMQLFYLICIIIKEVIWGLIIGLILSLPFWIFHAVGSFIDNQRGATLSSTLDPSSGIDSSELAKLFNMFAAIVYLEHGGMHHVVTVLYKSYLYFEPLNFVLPEPIPFLKYISVLMINTIQISSPVIAVMLLSEVFLGLLSRYASQLNAFAVSLSVKSGLAFLILILYFNPVFIDKIVNLTPSIDVIKSYMRHYG